MLLAEKFSYHSPTPTSEIDYNYICRIAKEVIFMKYECNQCHMGVEGMKCAHCGKELVHDVVDFEGEKVGVSKCPSGCGMIKSPICCGSDMKPHEMEAK